MTDINTKIETHRLILRSYDLDDLVAHTAIPGEWDVTSRLSSPLPEYAKCGQQTPWSEFYALDLTK